MGDNAEAWYMARIQELESKLDVAVDALRRHGYRESCDIPACNCGAQWNHGGHAVERLRELADVLYENGKTPLTVAKELSSRLEHCQKDLAERVVVETALRNATEARVLFRCPKCSTETRIQNPLTHLDCLGCGATIISEERPKPSLTVVETQFPSGMNGECDHRWEPRAGGMGEEYCSRCGLVLDENGIPTKERERV